MMLNHCQYVSSHVSVFTDNIIGFLYHIRTSLVYHSSFDLSLPFTCVLNCLFFFSFSKDCMVRKELVVVLISIYKHLYRIYKGEER